MFSEKLIKDRSGVNQVAIFSKKMKQKARMSRKIYIPGKQ